MLLSEFICDECGKRVEKPNDLGEDESKPEGWFYFALHIHPNISHADFQECNQTGHACGYDCLEKKVQRFTKTLFPKR